MICHDLLSDVMFRCARRPLFPCLASPASFLLPAPGLPAARPFFARIACARARPSAPARFARLIARASPAEGARLPFVPLGIFRAGAKPETKRPPDAASSCPHLYHGFFRVKPLERNYFAISRTRPASGQIMSRPAAGRAGTAPGRRLRATAPRSSRGGASAGARPGRRESRLRRARRSAAKVCGSATASRSSPPRSAVGPMTGGFDLRRINRNSDAPCRRLAARSKLNGPQVEDLKASMRT